MRALAPVGALAAVTGLAFGLMSAPAFAAPSAAVSSAGDVGAKVWKVKKAKNVSGAPSKKLVCTYVRSHGGTRVHGKACFQPKGDKFWVKDMRADGMNVVMRGLPRGNYQVIRDCENHHGKAAGWTSCNFNMKENQHVSFNILAYKGSTLKYTGLDVSSPN